MHQINTNSSPPQGSRFASLGNPRQPGRGQTERTRFAPHPGYLHRRCYCPFSRTTHQTARGWRCGTEVTDITERLGLDDSLRKSFPLGLAPWCGSRGVTFDQDLGSLTGSSDVFDPVARLTIATSALARLPPVDIELWTDGSALPGVGAGGRFVIYVHGLLHYIQQKLIRQAVNPPTSGLRRLP